MVDSVNSFILGDNRVTNSDISEQLETIDQAGARGVVVIVVGNGHDDPSSNPGRDWLHFTLC